MNGIFESVIKYKWPVIKINAGNTKIQKKYKMAIPSLNTLIVASWVIRARWREIKRFVLEFKARLFFLNSYIFTTFSLKSVTYELNLHCIIVQDQFLENLNFSIHFL